MSLKIILTLRPCKHCQTEINMCLKFWVLQRLMGETSFDSVLEFAKMEGNVGEL